ncbi:radical SAM protein [Acetonema longum]|uniref:Radical SAM domain-containing protein n=1 Tax=Acetonema longum DSM 6540 TaxID=1009370 RepID=F7NIM1_9FIRM|nr:radical SAM protein [Acetonema longum]EGO64085.1 radical SAM domain-containing protein [Acetonema longum DSM 6540]
MYFDDAEGMVFRPPSEANSFILRVTVGCSHNRCAFCSMYRDVKFRIRPLEEIIPLIRLAARQAPLLRRVFLADGNAMVLRTETLLTIMQELRQAFPKLSRITCYGGPKDILRKTPEELSALREAGLQIIYLGIESGDDQVLALADKGVTGAEMAEAGQKVLAAGLKLSAMVILGLGGKELSHQHAVHTGQVISQINPTMLSALTLMLHEGTPLRSLVEQGRFQPLSPYEIILELKTMLEHTHLTKPSLFRCNHASNLVPLSGTLPQDKKKLLQDLEWLETAYKNKNNPMLNDTGLF